MKQLDNHTTARIAGLSGNIAERVQEHKKLIHAVFIVMMKDAGFTTIAEDIAERGMPSVFCSPNLYDTLKESIGDYVSVYRAETNVQNYLNLIYAAKPCTAESTT